MPCFYMRRGPAARHFIGQAVPYRALPGWNATCCVMLEPSRKEIER